LCVVGRCKELGPDADQQKAAEATARLMAAVREEFPESDPLSLALAERLVELSAGTGVASVQAARALAELVAFQREQV